MKNSSALIRRVLFCAAGFVLVVAGWMWLAYVLGFAGAAAAP